MILINPDLLHGVWYVPSKLNVSTLRFSMLTDVNEKYFNDQTWSVGADSQKRPKHWPHSNCINIEYPFV